MNSLFASQTEIGTRYITTTGWPVTVIKKDKMVTVRVELTGNLVPLFPNQLLLPYNPTLISKEAMDMAKAHKAGGKSGEHTPRGEDRGAKKTAGGILLHRTVKGVAHEVLFHDGVLTYRNQDYTSLRDVAEAIRGKKISGSGRSFFGLRTNGNIELGKDVIKGLAASQDAKDAEQKKAAKPAKAKKAKRAPEAEEDDDGKASAKSVGETVAKVFGRRR